MSDINTCSYIESILFFLKLLLVCVYVSVSCPMFVSVPPLHRVGVGAPKRDVHLANCMLMRLHNESIVLKLG